MDIVCFGQQNWDYCWTGKQQLTTRLARRGHRVLYVDPHPALDVQTAADAFRALVPARTAFGLREAAPGLHVFTHRHAPPLGWRLNERRRPAILRALLARLGMPAPLALTLHPDSAPLVAAIPAAASVYYAVDEMSAFGGMPEAERARMREAEEDLLASVDLALCVSPRLLARFTAVNARSYLLENGADLEHFAPGRLARAPAHEAFSTIPQPRLGFVGQVDERLDQGLLVSLARGHRDWQIVLAGRVKAGVDVSALDAEPNIHLLGYQPYEALPSVLAGVDVCLVPYRLTELTHSCNPLKVFEYLATGRPVVTTPLDGLRACREAVALADTPEAFEAAVAAALAHPGAGLEQRLGVAAANTWDHRVDELERRLEEALAAGAARRESAGGDSRPRRRGSRARRTATGPLALDRLSAKQHVAFGAMAVAGRAYHAVRVAARTLRQGREPRVRRILVARRCRLGDLVVFLPALAALRARFPDARIVLAVQPGFSGGALLAASRDVDEVRVLDFLARPTLGGRIAGALALFAEGFDLVVSGAGFFLLREAFFAGAPVRIGLDDGHPLQRLNSEIVPLDHTRHEVENNLALVASLGGVRRPPVVPLPLDPEAVAAGGRRVAAALDLPDGAPVLVVHPGAQKPSRRWPVARMGLLVARLLEERPALHVVLTGVPDEAPLVDALRAALPEPVRDRARSAVGLTDLPSLVGLLDRAAAVVVNDTGLLHLARARGTPLTALLGPENDRRWGPTPVGPGPAIALRHEVPCAPCVRWDCEALYCLTALGVDEVHSAVVRMLDAGRSPEGRPEVPLERHATRWSFERLAAAGHDLPLVSALLTAAGGADNGAPERVIPRIEEALVAVARQSYPRVEVVVVLPAGDAEVRLAMAAAMRRSPVPLRLAFAPAGDPAEVWRVAIATARGAVLAPLDPRVVWSGEFLAAAVAHLVREPEVDAVAGHVAGADGATPPLGTLAARRAAVDAVADRPDAAGPWARLVATRRVARLDGPAARLVPPVAPAPSVRPRAGRRVATPAAPAGPGARSIPARSAGPGAS
jgi:ADP-heptose:LPS heptosyltransferase/glycosyltransferase involved in cell wall biosynthesis